MATSGPLADVIKSMIVDFHETRPDSGVPRRLRVEPVRGKATVCIGVRRGGKSTYLFQIVERLLGSGVPRENILYLNFFDDRLHDLRHGSLALVPEAYFSLFPEKKNVELVYCFFDEIQAAAGWEPFVDRLLRTERCEVYLTGSSAQLLSTEIATPDARPGVVLGAVSLLVPGVPGLSRDQERGRTVDQGVAGACVTPSTSTGKRAASPK